jgi:uncharacterized protein YjbI with pentapeptide repeats
VSRRQIHWLVGAMLAVIAFGASVLWWPPGAPADGSNLLGAALLASTIVGLAVLVAEHLVSKQMREIEDRNSLAAQERGLRREEAEEARQRQRRERIDKWALQLMAIFQQDLRMVDLSGRDMSGLYLRACTLLRANLKGTNLEGANLNGAYLAWSYLGEATLKGADLGEADLAGAGLEGADLSGANLCGTSLTRADLTGAKLAGASYDRRTAWPEGFEPRDSGAERLET